jgi:hypothetical protein
MRNYNYLLIALFFFGCSSVNVNENTDRISLISETYIHANLEVLSHDLYEGREATTRGEHLASLFITSELKKYGVKTFENSVSYLQPFELEKRLVSGNSIISFNDKKYFYGSDFVRGSRGLLSFNGNYDLVFAGYGITADEYEYNDYLNIDVTGKVVIIIPGEPEKENDTNFFEGNKASSYSNNNYKVRNAKENGATAVLFVPSEQISSNWENYVKFFTGSSLRINSNVDQSSENNIPSFTLSNEFYKDIFNGDYNFEYINYNSLKNVESFTLNKKYNFNIELEIENVITNNIIGMIEGNDPILKDEYVFIGAHYDHTGITGNSIFNGADDNGSGTVALLETARAFSQSRNNKRSVVFIFFAAEEKGLLGSRYFTDTYQKQK